MGIGGGPGEWAGYALADYEWVRLADLPHPRRRTTTERARPGAAAATGSADGESLGPALTDWLRRNPLWQEDSRARVLLVDLDNLRADPSRWRARMTAVVALAREADHTVLAGQQGAVERARPHLAEFAAQALGVADGSDVADHALLDAAEEVREELDQVVVLSNDGIFAQLADHGGRLTVLSPGADALSDRLRDAATRVVDLAEVERDVART
ncbi:MAG: hypothetical protein M3P95_03650 [Actinomycetota bacterium]|nr:hypothetical protein [Actinomycetota bacterium]